MLLKSNSFQSYFLEGIGKRVSKVCIFRVQALICLIQTFLLECGPLACAIWHKLEPSMEYKDCGTILLLVMLAAYTEV